MKVLIIGGTGVFGQRLAQMLIADGHDVLVASRNLGRSTALAEALGCKPLAFDRADDAAACFAQHRPDIVVDAAGPFQSYGRGRFSIPHAALSAGAHYLDLSDDDDFCAGITELDELARAASKVALSGVSSVPALSSAIAKALSRDMAEIILIESTILPGNRAPRGLSVVRAILCQVGSPMQVWRGGEWQSVVGWSGNLCTQLGENLSRCAAFIGAPDLSLFPGFFKARSVIFRAGLELGAMHHSLRLLSLFRRVKMLPGLEKFTVPFHWIATRLEPFGTDIGGMRVAVVGRLDDGSAEQREWTLIASAGDGPNIPAIPARLLINVFQTAPPSPGARPCLAEFDETQAERELARFSIQTATHTRKVAALFENALCEDWGKVPKPMRDMHDVFDQHVATGRAQIHRGTNLLSRLIGWAFRFPPESADTPVQVIMSKTHNGERWTRRFGSHIMRSDLSPCSDGASGFCERFGPFSFDVGLDWDGIGLNMPILRGRFLGVPLPHFILPTSIAHERVENARFFFDIRLSAPLAGLLVHYTGWLELPWHSAGD